MIFFPAVIFGAFHVTFTALDRATALTGWGAVKALAEELVVGLGGVGELLAAEPVKTLYRGEDGKLEPREVTVRTCM